MMMCLSTNIKTDSHFVSLIIPTIGRESLKITKAAVKSQTRPPDELIVVFDNERRGPGWARTEGCIKSAGDLIVFTDDDCVPEKDWLERMVAAIDKYDADMVNSHYDETDPFLFEVRQRRKFPETVKINPDGLIGNTGNVIYRRHCLEQCIELDGFIFNPVFGAFAAEDIDLASRLRQRGCKLVYIDNNVSHLKKMTMLKYLEHQFNRGIGIGILYKEHKKNRQEIPPDKSLLWGDKKDRFAVLKWLVMIWKKILGPFDRKSFSRTKYFWIFWMGEKFQAVGFLYALIYKYRKCSTVKAGS